MWLCLWAYLLSTGLFWNLSSGEALCWPITSCTGWSTLVWMCLLAALCHSESRYHFVAWQQPCFSRKTRCLTSMFSCQARCNGWRQSCDLWQRWIDDILKGWKKGGSCSQQRGHQYVKENVCLWSTVYISAAETLRCNCWCHHQTKPSNSNSTAYRHSVFGKTDVVIRFGKALVTHHRLLAKRWALIMLR